jgi:hypothetical protein
VCESHAERKQHDVKLRKYKQRSRASDSDDPWRILSQIILSDRRKDAEDAAIYVGKSTVPHIVLSGSNHQVE